jgi:transcriptional regulator with XRE-family HTH domain
MATNIFEQRKLLGMSQTDLAQRLGMSRPTLIKVEKGERELTAGEAGELEKVIAAVTEPSNNPNMRINIPEQNLEKFKQVLLYTLEKVGAKPNVGMTVLYKLFYFMDFDYYEKYEQQLMGLTYLRNTHGPTPREFVAVVESMKEDGELIEVKSKYFQHEQKKFLPKNEPNLALLTGQEMELIDDVLKRYSDKSATTLSDMTHRDTPWLSTAEGEDIDYELAFYRPDEFSVRDYGEL